MLPAAAVSSIGYPAAVAADNPVLWYELSEKSGTVAYDSSSSLHNGTYQGGVIYDAAGPMTPGVTLDGSSAYISNANVVVSPSSFSLDIWFRTTTRNGGLIIGFGNSITGASTNYDRHIYMGNSGQVCFGVAFGQTIHSTGAYNDGLWHEATATIGPAGMCLYIDGSPAASSTSTTASAQIYSGSWRVGYNSVGGSSAQVNSRHFAGSVAQASVYDYQLSAEQVAAHYGAAAQPLAVSEAVVSAGEMGSAYSHPLTATGGTVPYTWSVSRGRLPDGITLDAGSGELSGTPAAAGTFAFTVQVIDNAAQAAARATSLLVVAGSPTEAAPAEPTEAAEATGTPAAPALSFPVPSGEAGASYRHELEIAGGTAPYGWEVSDGELPDGITLDPGTGALTGTPARAGGYHFTVRVTDAADQSVTRVTSLTIVAAAAIGVPSPPDGETGADYRHELTVTGGTAPYHWEVSDGELPDGINLDAETGTLYGTPASAGHYHFTVRVTDAAGQCAAQAVSLAIGSS